MVDTRLDHRWVADDGWHSGHGAIIIGLTHLASPVATLVSCPLAAPELAIVAALTLAMVQDPGPVIAGEHHQGVLIDASQYELIIQISDNTLVNTPCPPGSP